VANLPVEVALNEGAELIIASYLGDTDKIGSNLGTGNALSVANRMLEILMRQNERRNIALLRAHDILVRPQLQDFSSGSFRQPSEIIQVGREAVDAQDNRFRQLALQFASATSAPAEPPNILPPQGTLQRIRVTGNQHVPKGFVERELQSLLGKPFKPQEVTQKLDDLYASGNFERVNYRLSPLPEQTDGYELVVEVNEKTYGPNFLKTSLGFYGESSGTSLFSLGVGFRRPWLTPDGLELQLDVRGGSQSELAVSLYQPLTESWGLNGYAAYNSSELSIYRPDVTIAQKMASSTLRRQELGVNLSYDLGKKATAKLGVVTNQTRVTIDTAHLVSYRLNAGNQITYNMQDGKWEFTGVNAEFTADLLDSPSFPTKGYYLHIAGAEGVTGTSQYTSFRANLLWARSFGPHVLNLGVDLGADHIFDCDGCAQPTSLAPLYLGGFQSMGAYQMGQLSGDRLIHAQATYMYRLTDGGVLRQPTFVGFVAEVGDAWLSTGDFAAKYSGTAFLAVDSRIGDVFFGVASGSGGNRNIFLQLGRRFSLW